VHKADKLTILKRLPSRNFGSLKLLDLEGLVQACNGLPLPIYFTKQQTTLIPCIAIFIILDSKLEDKRFCTERHQRRSNF